MTSTNQNTGELRSNDKTQQAQRFEAEFLEVFDQLSDRNKEIILIVAREAAREAQSRPGNE